MIGIRYEVDPPRSVYYQGWGNDCTNPKVIVCTWALHTVNQSSNPVEIGFDLTDGDAPFILGIDFPQYADTCNTRDPRVIHFHRPRDAGICTMFSYISPDHYGNKRLSLEVVPKSSISCSSLLSAHPACDALTMVPKVHHFSHAHMNYIKAILQDAGRIYGESNRPCGNVYNSCSVSVKMGRPTQHRKVSLTHVNSCFNSELQAYFAVV